MPTKKDHAKFHLPLGTCPVDFALYTRDMEGGGGGGVTGWAGGWGDHRRGGWGQPAEGAAGLRLRQAGPGRAAAGPLGVRDGGQLKVQDWCRSPSNWCPCSPPFLVGRVLSTKDYRKKSGTLILSSQIWRTLCKFGAFARGCDFRVFGNEGIHFTHLFLKNPPG